MHFLFKICLIILSIILFMQCTTNKANLKLEKPDPNQRDTKQRYVRDPEKYTKKVLADRCRIIGIIKDIDTTRFSEDTETPCGQYPCFATIVIEDILGYGSGFSSKVSKGQDIKVNFKFTLTASDKIAPDLELALPGLKVNDKFIADLEALPIIGQNKVEYTIYRYEIVRD